MLQYTYQRYVKMPQGLQTMFRRWILVIFQALKISTTHIHVQIFAHIVQLLEGTIFLHVLHTEFVVLQYHTNGV